MKGNNSTFEKTVAAGKRTREKEFWFNKLSEGFVKSNFAYDHTSETFVPGTMEFQFEENLNNKIAQLKIDANDYSLNLFLTAGVIVLLKRYTGRDDVILGTTIYKQETQKELINTVLILNENFSDELTFKETLIKAKNMIQEATEHYRYPTEVLLRDLGLTAAENQFPFFDVAVILENIHDREYLKGIPVNVLFSFKKENNGIRGKIEYDQALYRESTIERIINYFFQILETGLENSRIKISEIEILSEKERHQLLQQFNDPYKKNGEVIESWKDTTVIDWFEEQVNRTSERVALEFEDQQLTYGELNHKSNQLARLLREQGVYRDCIVGLMVDRSIEMIISYWGIVKAGGAYLPIDPVYPEKRILIMLEASDVSILLSSDRVVKTFHYRSLMNLKSDDGNCVKTPSRPQIMDFDGLVKPNRTLVDYSKYHPFIGNAMVTNSISIQSTRGCPYLCTYCHKIWSKKHRCRSAENIFEEVKMCYDAGVKRFAFIDDIFNLDIKNSSRFFQMILDAGMDVRFFYGNGLRADVMTRDYIDLMVKAGTANIALALESASPRLQKLMKKNLNLKKIRENIDYITEHHPQVILELFTMHGFPTETEEEAMMTMEFIQQTKWVHFPYIQILKIFPDTEMYELASENGVSDELIEASVDLAYHEIPETLPYPKSFTRKYQSLFMDEYFLNRERLLHVLPHQMRALTENELVQKYDSYLPVKIRKFSDILDFVKIDREELGDIEILPESQVKVTQFNEKLHVYYPIQEKNKDALKIMYLDLSQLFTKESENVLYNVSEAPLGLIYLRTFLDQQYGTKVDGKIIKSRIDFDDYEGLKEILLEYKPDLMAIRTLSFFRDFFHRTLSLIRGWGIDVPVITGGPYASSEYKSVLQDSNVDVVVFGEGEITFSELIGKVLENNNKMPSYEELEKIQGIAFLREEHKKAMKKARKIFLVDTMDDILSRYIGDNLPKVNTPKDLHYVIYTSGSTGRPKGMMLTHGTVRNIIEYQYNHTNIDNSRVLQYRTISFDISNQEIHSPLLMGGTLFLIDNDMRMNIPELFQVIESRQIKSLFLPMALLKLIFKQEEYRRIFPKCVAHIQSSGEQVIINEEFKRYLKENHIYLHDHYGPAETHVVTGCSLDPREEIPTIPPIGKPFINSGAYILDKNMSLMPMGAVGILYMGGIHVGRGYLDNIQLTYERFVKNPFKEGDVLYNTGDLARWLPDGDIEFLGRADNQVKIRGFRVELGEIETQMLKHPDIGEVLVIAREDENEDRYLCAYFVLDKAKVEKEGTYTLHTSDLRRYLTRNLPDYMIPAYFIQLQDIPLSSNNKVNRKMLPLPELESEIEYVAPRDEKEYQMVNIWSEILGVSRIGIYDSFFDLGGNSLKAAVLITRIHQVFDVRITLREMFLKPTVLGMVEFIKSSSKEEFTSIPPVEKKDYYLLSSAQKRLFILQEINPDNTFYNLPYLLPLVKDVDIEKVKITFERIISRHEILRTSFHMREGESCQRIEEEVPFEIEIPDTEGLDFGGDRDALNDWAMTTLVTPFDFEKPPLMRVKMIFLDNGDKYLFIDIHHIITDAASQLLLTREFHELYAGNILPHLRIQYKDFAEWQNSKEYKKRTLLQERFWMRKLHGELPVLQLPLDFPRPAVQNFEGATAQFLLGKEEAKGIKRISKEKDATSFMVLLSLYTILLSKITGMEDIIVGSPLSGRLHNDLQPLIGMFLNTLVLRNYPTEERTYSEYLSNVKHHILEAFENQEYQFEDQVESLVKNRDFSRNPIFDVVFSFLVQEEQTEETKIMDEGTIIHKQTTSKFDMALRGLDLGETIFFGFEYSTKLFKKESMGRFISSFKEIVGQVTADPNIKIGEIDVFGQEEAGEEETLKDSFDDLENEVGF
jgi:amino acid adenylation domain-containing protein